MIVLLDDVNSAAQVAPLLPGTGGSLVLVTSRRRLTGLSVQYGALRLTLEALTADEAVLLLRRVLDRRAAPASQRVSDAVLAAVARRCAYLPLALQIAAEHMAERGPVFAVSLTEELRRGASRLDLLAMPGEAETAVRSVFAWSYRALTSDLARAFRLLALHPGDVAGMGAVAALWGESPAVAARLIGELHAAHLVAKVAPGRYRMHDLLRDYAMELVKAEAGAERTDCTERVFAWYLHTAEAVADQLLGDGRRRAPLGPSPDGCRPLHFTSAAEALEWCESERENLLACVRAAQAADSPVAWQLPRTLWGFLLPRPTTTSSWAAGEAGYGFRPCREITAANSPDTAPRIHGRCCPLLPGFRSTGNTLIARAGWHRLSVADRWTGYRRRTTRRR
ncbi:hypothetical protein GXW82_08865 [Streptacidiphilus sp. 4-A2]|nr:hypothetical protein [Streptacidiphilus sp. 4-A2]